MRIIHLVNDYKDVEQCFPAIPTNYLEILTFTFHNDPSLTLALIGQFHVIAKCSSLKEFCTDSVDDELIEVIGQKITLESLELRLCHLDSTNYQTGLRL